MNTMEFTQSLQDSLFIASIFIAALFIICTVSLALRNYEASKQLKKLKKWRKFSEIEKKQKHEEYDRLASELTEERAFNDTQGSMHVRLMLKYAGIQEESDKLKKELKIAQAFLKVSGTEITELKAKLERKRNERGQFVKKCDCVECSKPERVAPCEHDLDWTKATKEELLDEAKRRYPVGTRVKCLHNTSFDLIETDSFKYDKYGYCMRHINKEGYVNCVYEFGKWAQILPNA